MVSKQSLGLILRVFAVAGVFLACAAPGGFGGGGFGGGGGGGGGAVSGHAGVGTNGLGGPIPIGGVIGFLVVGVLAVYVFYWLTRAENALDFLRGQSTKEGIPYRDGLAFWLLLSDGGDVVWPLYENLSATSPTSPVSRMEFLYALIDAVQLENVISAGSVRLDHTANAREVADFAHDVFQHMADAAKVRFDTKRFDGDIETEHPDAQPHQRGVGSCLVGITVITPVFSQEVESEDAQTVLQTLGKAADHHNTENTGMYVFVTPNPGESLSTGEGWRLCRAAIAALRTPSLS